MDIFQELHTMFEVAPSKEAGKSQRGLFAKKDLVPGIVLPYPCISEPVLEGERRYNLAAEYRDMRKGTYHSVPSLELNGDPCLFQHRLDDSWTFAARINEPSKRTQNSHMIVNPLLTRAMIWQSYMQDKPIVGAYAVISAPVARGEEILTHYGEGFDRNYRVKPPDDTPAKIDMCLNAVMQSISTETFALNLGALSERQSTRR